MRKLAALSFSFSAAVVLCQYMIPQAAWLWAAVACLILFGGGFLFLRGNRRLRLCLVCAGLAVGFVWTAFYDAVFFAAARKLDDHTIRMSAVVTDYPRQRDYGWQVSARMETQRGRPLHVLLYTDDQGADLRPGDRIESVTHCTLGTTSSAGEEITYYTAKGVFLWGKCYGTLSIDRPENIPVPYLPAHLAHLLKNGIDAAFPEDTAGIIRAVVTGSRDKLTDEFTSSLERTGLSHTVAVSGMHLSCFAGLLAILLGRGKRSTACLVILWAALFSGVAGSTPSVSRAAVMIVLLQIAPLLRRERDDATALGFALMLLLFWNPYSAAHVGLQLSFAAVAGIFLLAGPMQQKILEKLGLLGRVESQTLHLLRTIVCGLIGVICTTLGAMVTTVPLTAVHFGSLSLIAPVTNLLTLWAMTVVFAAGMAVGLLGLFIPDLACVLAVPVSALARYVEGCSGYFSGLTFSALSLESPYYRLWVGFFYLLLIGAVFCRGKRRVVIPACCGAVTLCAAIMLTASQLFSGGMTVTALDVGQGQSILLRCADNLVLVDCGGDAPDNAGDIAADYIQSHGRSCIDALILTHYHDDHANGAAQILRRVAVEHLILPDVEEENPLRGELLALAREKNIPVTFIRTDTVLSVDEDSRLTCFPPLNSADNANEQGLTVLAQEGDFEVLITGDMNGRTEQMLLRYAELPDTELLIAGHHGSNDSTSPLLLETVAPEVCIISVGAHNRYGHPGEETLKRLREAGTELYRTDQSGHITLTLN